VAAILDGFINHERWEGLLLMSQPDEVNHCPYCGLRPIKLSGGDPAKERIAECKRCHLTFSVTVISYESGGSRAAASGASSYEGKTRS
jgi:hypothetical protein